MEGVKVIQRRELHLRETIKNKRGENVGVLVEGPNVWERQPNGDYLVQLEGLTEHEFVLPSTSVKYEKRPKATQVQPQAGSGGAKR
jgi:hypothetical protein